MHLRVLLLGAVLAATLPLSGASAEHCATPIWFLTGTGVTLYTGTTGCDVIVDDIPETPFDESNTDLIVPGAASGVVRWMLPDEPLDGRLVDGAVVGSQITFAGKTTPLKFEQGEDLTGEPASFWDSQDIPIGRAPSITGGAAVITVCYASAPDECESRTYRTVSALAG